MKTILVQKLKQVQSEFEKMFNEDVCDNWSLNGFLEHLDNCINDVQEEIDDEEDPEYNEDLINIVYYSEVIDNFGRIEGSFKGHIIRDALVNVESWTDDMLFEDIKGQKYTIDELAGKQVYIFSLREVIKVPTDDSNIEE